MILYPMYAFTGIPFCFADCTKENTFEEENKKVIAYHVVYYICKLFCKVSFPCVV